jgi:hypothetical protein
MTRLLCLVTVVVGVAAATGATQSRPGSQQPLRDTPARRQDAKPPASLIAGHVLAADTGKPVSRARVFVSAPELSEGRGQLTDDSGLFEFSGLPEGRYTLTVSKAGFVPLSYGQRRPLQPGMPIQLPEGQQIKGLDVRLPRGGVIGGHVFDERGDPAPGVRVRVLRFQYVQGERRMTPAGGSQTDDRGAFRVWGLNPGDYYLDAQAPLNSDIGEARDAESADARDAARLTYAPTYYPGVASPAEARPITLGLSQQALFADFTLQLVPAVRISGHVIAPDGRAASNADITLMPDVSIIGPAGGGFEVNYGASVGVAGTFQISNVPTGRYTLQARGNVGGVPQFASLPLVVADTNIDELTLAMANSANISGTLVFIPGRSQPPDPNEMFVSAPSTQPSIGQMLATPNREGKFMLVGVQAGLHLIRAGGQLRGWTLKSVSVGDRDVTDTPIALRSGSELSNVVLTFTDKMAEIVGTVATDQGVPVADYTVLAFATEPSLWYPQTRHIATARPDQNGTFAIRGLPAGSYYMNIVDPGEQGEWFDPAYLDQHRASATRVTVADGETKTQDFRLAAR